MTALRSNAVARKLLLMIFNEEHPFEKACFGGGAHFRRVHARAKSLSYDTRMCSLTRICSLTRMCSLAGTRRAMSLGYGS